MELLGLGDVRTFDPADSWRPRPVARPAPRPDRHLGDRGDGQPRPQGVRPAGHGSARPGDRRDRVGQVGVPAHPGARADHDALAGAAQPRPRRLQGRRDVRRHVRAAARLGDDHQPRSRSSPSSTGCRTPSRARWSAARSCSARPATSPRSATTRRPGSRAATAPSWRRCRRCSSWSTSSPSCSRPSPSSSTSSWPSAGSAGRSGCTCCWPRSGSRRVGCAGWSPTCPTGSVCARSAAQESRTVLGVPDAYELPAVPGLGYLKPDPTALVRFKAAYVSGPPVGRVRVRRDEGGKLQGILPFTISEVQKLDVEVPAAEPAPAAGRAGRPGHAARARRRPHGRPRDRPPTGCGCRRSTSPTPSTA